MMHSQNPTQRHRTYLIRPQRCSIAPALDMKAFAAMLWESAKLLVTVTEPFEFH